MNRYQPPTPRTALGLAAVALTAVTLGVWVIAPAGSAPANAPASPLVSAQPAMAPADTAEVTRIEVIGVRPAPSPVQLSRAMVFHAKHKQSS